MSGAEYVGEVLSGDTNQVLTVTAAAAAPPGSAVPACAAGDLWGAAGLQPVPCTPWAQTGGTGLAPTVDAGGAAAAVVPQAPTGQFAAFGEAGTALAWPYGVATDASFDCSSFGTAEQAQPSAPDPSMQLLLFQQLLETLPEHQSARQQGSATTFRAPPRLPGVGLLGCAAVSSNPLPAREGTATTAAAAAGTAAAATAAAAVPLDEASKGGGSGSSLLHLQPHASSTLWGADSEGAQQDDAARAAHAGAGAKRKKKARHRDCLSRIVAKAAEAVEAASLEIEQEQADIQRGRKVEQALEQLLDYQQHLVHAVEQQERGSGLQIPAEALKLLKEEDVSKAFPLDTILRYPVAGDMGNMGPDGRVNKVAAFSEVLEDWRQIVGGLKQLVWGALVSDRTALDKLGQQELGRASNSLLLPEGASWESQGYFEFGSLSQQQQEQQRQQLLLSSNSRPMPAKHTASGELKLAVTTAVKVAAALGQRSQGAACEEDAFENREVVAESGEPSCAPEPNSLRPSSQAEIHVRRMLVLDRLRGHEHATTADGRLVVQHVEGTHIFSKDQLKDLAQLLYRAGVLLWQQVLLCPDNFGKLASRRLDVGPDGDDTLGAQFSSHWEAVVDLLELEPKQASEIVQLYREYHDKLQAAKEDRAAAAETVQQIQAQLESLSLGLGPRAQALLELQRAAGALAKCSLKEHLPYVVLVYSVYRVLNFPLQRAKLFTASWPYFPQIDQLATLAARRFHLATTPSENGGTPDGGDQV